VLALVTAALTLTLNDHHCIEYGVSRSDSTLTATADVPVNPAMYVAACHSQPSTPLQLANARYELVNSDPYAPLYCTPPVLLCCCSNACLRRTHSASIVHTPRIAVSSCLERALDDC
jgi:hypothetical protein